jgi:iron(III) transport system permease protein
MALSLGASRWRVFRTVTLPLCVPGLANAFLLLFAASLADFATPLILAGNQFPVLPTQAYLQITGLFDLRGGAALSLGAARAVARGVPAAALLGEPPLLRDGDRQGRRADAVRQRLAGRSRGAAGVLRAGRGWRSSYFYALLLYASLVVALGANHAFTLAHYRVIFTEGSR